MPVLPLRGLVVFPNMLLHFDVARPQSVKALDRAMKDGGPVFLVPQRDLSVEEPQPEDLCAVGTVCAIRQLLRLPGGSVRVLVEGTSRGRIAAMTQLAPCMEAEVETISTVSRTRNSPRTEALIRQVYDVYGHYAELAPTTPETLLNVLSSNDPGYIADHIAQNVSLRAEDKQTILTELRPVRRLEKLCRLLQREVEILTLESDVETKVRQGLDQNQRDYYLREQLRVVQAELGEEDEFSDYRQRIAQAKLPAEVEERLAKEVSRMEKQPYGSAEATVSRNYLDVCLELPWGNVTQDRIDIQAARTVLDKDHYGMEKVKERIIEYLAVRQLTPDLKG